MLGYRKISNATNERTFIASLFPSNKDAGDSIIEIYIDQILNSAILQDLITSIPFDYSVKQKMGGSNMNTFITKQLPTHTPDQIPSAMQWQIAKRVAELCYFNYDMDGWVSELWDEMIEKQRTELPQLGAQQPWIYNPERRAILQAELDAIIAHFYGLNSENLRYILDPEDVCGKGCINETFRVLKDNEIRQYGEYRTKRLVLEAWNKFGFDN